MSGPLEAFLCDWLLIHNELDFPPPFRNAGLYEAPGLDDEELNMTLGIMCSRTIIGFDGSPALQ